MTSYDKDAKDQPSNAILARGLEELPGSNGLYGGNSSKLFCPSASVAANIEEVRRNKKKLILVSALCFLFMIGETVAGILAGSLAIISDAAHLFSDIAGFVISLVALIITQRPATRKLSFGFHRAEVIGAVFSVSLIWAVTIFLVIEAIGRLQHPQPIKGEMMAIVAAAGLAFNIAMAFILYHGYGHGHGQGYAKRDKNHGVHRHSDSEKKSNRGEKTRKRDVNLNIRAALIHVVGDMVQSIAVLLAALIIYYKPEWTAADPICTFFFSVLVLITTLKLLKEAIHVLMEGTPSDINPEMLQTDLLKIPGVKRIHDLHIWCLSPSETSITLHVVVHSRPLLSEAATAVSVASTQVQPMHAPVPMVSIEEYRSILAQCQSVICEKYKIHHSTIQIECDDDITAHCVPSLCRQAD